MQERAPRWLRLPVDKPAVQRRFMWFGQVMYDQAASRSGAPQAHRPIVRSNRLIAISQAPGKQCEHPAPPAELSRRRSVANCRRP